MRSLRTPMAGLFLMAAATLSQAQIVADFENGQNLGGWTFGNTLESIQPGGNPGMHLRNHEIDTFAPQPRTTDPGAPFHDDYRALGVTSVGVDLITYSTQFPADRELSLILSSGGCNVYFKGEPRVPQPGSGWKSFSFAVDAASTTLPAGWSVLNGCGSDDATWNTVITNVTEVRFFYGDPTFFFIFDIWDVGMDNARLELGVGTSYCSGDGTGSPCPCGNTGGPGLGCASSAGPGAHLLGGGGTGVAADALTFTATGLTPVESALLYAGQSTVAGGAGAPFGDGLRCAGVGVVRLGALTSSGAGEASWGPGLAAQGGWSPGDTRYFQVWYRDASGSVCGSGFNLTQGVAVTFTP